jgi:hypothetical protein
VSAYVPPGWPDDVHPPGTERFQDTAVAWLLELLPSEYRRYGVLRRYPLALAGMARRHVEACVEAARQGFRTVRADLGGVVPPHGIDSILEAYRCEGTRLAGLSTAAELVETALRGSATPEFRRRFTPRV